MPPLNTGIVGGLEAPYRIRFAGSPTSSAQRRVNNVHTSIGGLFAELG